MELKPIRTKREYETRLKPAEAWWDAPAATREAEQLDVLAGQFVSSDRDDFFQRLMG